MPMPYDYAECKTLPRKNFSLMSLTPEGMRYLEGALFDRQRAAYHQFFIASMVGRLEATVQPR